MKRNGFTLIELVVVIVILGILAVSAAPRFLNLTTDARVSVLKGAQAAVKGMDSLVYSKAVINSLEAKQKSTITIDEISYDLIKGHAKLVDQNNIKEILDTDLNVKFKRNSDGLMMIIYGGAESSSTKKHPKLQIRGASG